MSAWQQALQNTLAAAPTARPAHQRPRSRRVPDRPLDHASVREFGRRIRAMTAQGFTGQEVADALHCSLFTVRRHIREGKKK
jgi:DNA-binding CsgD family transcriptional regulator